MGKLRRYNWFGGGLAWLWLIVIMIPIWFMLVSTFKSQPDYFAGNPLAPLPVRRWTTSPRRSTTDSGATS